MIIRGGITLPTSNTCVCVCVSSESEEIKKGERERAEKLTKCRVNEYGVCVFYGQPHTLRKKKNSSLTGTDTDTHTILSSTFYPVVIGLAVCSLLDNNAQKTVFILAYVRKRVRVLLLLSLSLLHYRFISCYLSLTSLIFPANNELSHSLFVTLLLFVLTGS